MRKHLFFILGFFLLGNFSLAASGTDPTNFSPSTSLGSISANPAAVNLKTGTGAAERYVENMLGIKDDHGIYFGASWLGDVNQLFSGGIPNPDRTTLNSSLLLNLAVDTEKLYGWEGGSFGLEILQLNAQSTNKQAGSVQGYNSIPGPPPLNRTELYQLWYRQTFFDNKLKIHIGKTVTTYFFNNVVKPVSLTEENLNIPAVSALIYTPIFVNSSMLGLIPGFYNSAYGITIIVMPTQSGYVSYGVYDGNLANGVQIGLKGPTFNGSYFHIGETGFAWLLGEYNKPGNFGLGLWHQAGPIEAPPTITENSANGYYLFGSQRLWYKNPGYDISGISAFYQYGVNTSRALPVNKYLGGGLTAFSLIPGRPDDSMGLGGALAWLNHNSFKRAHELIIQTYYQAKMMNWLYLEPVLSYMPTPGVNEGTGPVWAGTFRAIVLV